MSLESFFHEVALRQASADRDNPKFTPPWWKRWLAALPPAVKRIIAVVGGVAIAVAGWWLHPPINQYLLGNSPHLPGAADVLATVGRCTSPVERARRLVLACARENNTRACQDALRQALATAEPRVVVTWLKENEVHALRVNAYFEQFATDMETHPEHLNQRCKVSSAADAQPLPTAKHETRPAQTANSRDNSPALSPEHPNTLHPLSPASDRHMDFLLGPNATMQTDSPSVPGALVDVSIARSANPSDHINEPPVSRPSLKDDPSR